MSKENNHPSQIPTTPPPPIGEGEKKWYDIIYQKLAGKKINPKIFMYVGFGLLLMMGIIASTATNEEVASPQEYILKETPLPTLPPNINQNTPVSKKTFVNTKFGFSFTHPGLSDECCYITGPSVGEYEAIGNLSDPSSVVRGSKKPFNGFSMYIISLGNLSPDEYMKREAAALMSEYQENNHKELQNSSWQTLTVGDQPTILLKNYSSLIMNRYYIQLPSTNKILYLGANEERLGSFDKVLNQILASFSFNEDL